MTRSFTFFVFVDFCDVNKLIIYLKKVYDKQIETTIKCIVKFSKFKKIIYYLTIQSTLCCKISEITIRTLY